MLSLLNRLRCWALIRLVCYLAPLVALSVPQGYLVEEILGSHSLARLQPWIPATLLISAVAMLGAYALLVRAMERRPVQELSLRRAPLGLAGGLALGISLIASIPLLLWLSGAARWGPGRQLNGLFAELAAFLAAATYEELAMRAVLFRITEQVTGTTGAVLLSSIAFGLLHGANPEASLLSLLAIAVEAGIAFALIYALTRNLWLVIGFHAGWNFAEGCLFGGGVSGFWLPGTLLTTRLSGPAWLTGGSFGLEASVVTILVCLAVSLVLARLILRKGAWEPWRFRLSLP